MDDVLQLFVENTSTTMGGRLKGEIYKAFKRCLGYFDESSQFRTGGNPYWDGWVTTVCYNLEHCKCSVKKDGMHFPTGLISKACEFFRENGITFEIIDQRTIWTPQQLPYSIINQDADGKPFALYDYQKNVVNLSIKAQRGIIKLPTGSGKTLVASAIIAEVAVSPTIFYVTSIDFLEQAYTEITNFVHSNGLRQKIGRVGGGYKDIQNITVMTVQTAILALDGKYQKFDEEDSSDKTDINDIKPAIRELINSAKLIIVDECIAGDSMVTTEDGPYRIDDLSDKIGKKVLSYDGDKVVWKKMTHFYKKGKRKIVKIILSSGKSIRCTCSHLIKTTNGWLPAVAIKSGDHVLCYADVDANKNSPLSVVKSVEVDGCDDVYDITVEDTHCFFANEMLVHNCQHARAETIQTICDNSLCARWRYGLSIFADSQIELRGGCFGDGFYGTISEAWNICTSPAYKMFNFDVKDLHGIEGRSWNGKHFCWKPMRRILMHTNDRKSYKIRFAGKDNLRLTEDHSIFQLKGNEVIESKPTDLKVGDKLLMDDGEDWKESKSRTIWDCIKDCSPANLRASIDLSAHTVSLSKERVSCLSRRGAVAAKYGGSLYVSQYRETTNKTPKWLYTEAARGVGIDPRMSIRELSYLFGFYLGDGWISENRLNFAVENQRLHEFTHLIRKLFPHVRPKIRQMHGRSSEVRISCAPLALLFTTLFENKKCYDKFIPRFMFNECSRKELLRGLRDSDGSSKQSDNQLLRNCKQNSFTSTSPRLVNDIKLLLRSLGASYTLSVRKPARGGNIGGRIIQGKRTSYQVIWSANAVDGINDGHCGRIRTACGNEKKILEISECQPEGCVFDLEATGHPSFVANGVLVHNSATPYRDNGDDILIDACFGKPISHITASWLIQNNYLVKPHIAFVPITNLKGQKLGKWQDVYRIGVVENEYRNDWIARLAQALLEQGRNPIILIKNIEHGDILAEKIPGSVFIHGSTNKKMREGHIQLMKSGKSKITIASTILDEGIDCRPLDALILAGAGKSPTRALQRIGRVIRKHTYPDGRVKKNAFVYDIFDHLKYLSEHTHARRRIYRTEPEFEIRDFEME